MGSYIEINDTLQISKEQGFPEKLNIKKHFKKAFLAEDFKDDIFEFKNKKGVRLYKIPPVRNFFVENVDGKWIYWGLVHILETTYDYTNNTTSGKFKIIYINSPEEMLHTHNIIDRNPDTRFDYDSLKS